MTRDDDNASMTSTNDLGSWRALRLDDDVIAPTLKISTWDLSLCVYPHWLGFDVHGHDVLVLIMNISS